MEAALSDFRLGRSRATYPKIDCWLGDPWEGRREDGYHEQAAAAFVVCPPSPPPQGGSHKTCHLLSILKRDYRVGVSNSC